MATEALRPYPWQADQWRRLQQARAQGRLPHAVLLHGQRGLGLRHFARLLAQAVLCDTAVAEGLPCGECSSCRQFEQGLLADFRAVNIPEEKSQILVDQIRELVEFLSLTQGRAAGKVALIDPADAMNANAANSLLKTLEEPPGSALLVLVSEHLSRLPATIRSRCQIIKFARPPQPVALDWLAGRGVVEPEPALRLAHGLPCLVLEGAAESRQGLQQASMTAVRALLGGVPSASVRTAWQKFALPDVVNLLLGLSRDLLRVHAGISAGFFENPIAFNELQRAGRLIDSGAVGRLQDRLLELGEALTHPLNPDLARDRLLYDWLALSEHHVRITDRT